MNRRKAAGVILGLAVCIFSGCAFIGLEKQVKPLTDAGSINGKIETDEPVSKTGHLAVVVFRVHPDGKKKVYAYKLLSQAGTYHLTVSPGVYEIAAFADESGDFIYDDDEPSAICREKITVRPGGYVSEVNLRIMHSGSEPLDMPVNLSLTAPEKDATRQQLRIGKIISLDDDRFEDASGEMGLWKYDRFRKEIGGGVFFLEPYNPGKIPILFIHGYTGTPRDFKFLVSQIDQKKYQPWFVFYPSAARIGIIADHLNAAITQLQMVYKFREMSVIGYSMGGLVGRAFVLKHAEEHPESRIKNFISIATPWKGHSLADLRKLAPTEVPSWQDLATDSELLQWLFSKRLPKGTDYYLFFAYDGDRNIMRDNNDRFITLQSALDLRAQDEARKVLGFNETHDDILDSPEVARELNSILGSAVPKKSKMISFSKLKDPLKKVFRKRDRRSESRQPADSPSNSRAA
jgi:pimeloyl-ACP methyl ester carboxylesterase